MKQHSIELNLGMGKSPTHQNQGYESVSWLNPVALVPAWANNVDIPGLLFVPPRNPVDFVVEKLQLVPGVEEIYHRGEVDRQDFFVVCKDASPDIVDRISNTESELVDFFLSSYSGAQTPQFDIHLMPRPAARLPYQKIYPKPAATELKNSDAIEHRSSPARAE